MGSSTEAQQDGAEVEQRLRGMLCMPSPAFSTGRPVVRASSDGAPLALWRRTMHSAPERAQGEAGVLEGFALLDGGGLVADQRGGGAQRLGGELEGGAGARAGLVEEQGDACGRRAGARVRAERIAPVAR